MLKDFLNKIASGRYILTVITGLVFAVASLRGLVDKDVISTIVAMVFSLYFSRSDRNGKSEAMDKSKSV